MNSESELNTLAFNRICRKRHLKTCYFNDMSPDELIKKIEEIKESAKNLGYVNVNVSVDAYDYHDENTSAGIVAYGFSLETDDEYKSRLSANIATLKNNKKRWEDKSDFYNGTDPGNWKELIDNYTSAINSIKQTS